LFVHDDGRNFWLIALSQFTYSSIEQFLFSAQQDRQQLVNEVVDVLQGGLCGAKLAVTSKNNFKGNEIGIGENICYL
jgi:hypothetical protein